MIEIVHLTKHYGGRLTVDDLSLRIGRGKVFGFLGQNGAGKTTTMKMIVGLTEPDEGTVAIAGKPHTDLGMREHIGYMPEAPYFYDRLTGLEFMKFCASLFQASPKHTVKRYEEILQQVGIFDARHRAIGTYSKGMKQRLGFGQTLVNDPDYIFLDEPLDGLDPVGRQEIKNMIKDLHQAGKTIFFNSHILWDTEELCDEIGIIHAGKLLYHGGVTEFCQGEPLEKRFVALVQSQPNVHV